jgi:hypothetical protein
MRHGRRNTVSEQGVFEYLSQIQELVDINGFLDDEKFAETVDKVARLAVHPNVTPKTAASLIVEFEATAAVFKLKAKSYMLFPNPEHNKRKGIYLSCADSMMRIADALKYTAKLGV